MRIALSLGLLALFVSAGFLQADDDKKPKFTIKEVMKEHKKDKLRDKVTSGKASDEEKKKLLEMYEAMAANKAPKGEPESWKKLNDAILAAAKDVVDGKDGSADALKKATACGDCHSAHK